ncbi:3-oxoacyl-[acyl-carrier-protein] synthase III C-terminal domain-containing protein [Opitutus sp. ER46]|uniref:type III polyketide synthase n=1 Tax=Opitutus sp. ER46 TaxID=2161864 RepID=UPI000D30D216|nr:3-oxoacyl-[acyl-carrier-protein] synthase III C-terminal domain-containing protein [Opitutus sp. ER46]PTX94549.1 stilbene synthase [Opitutus sp. ER46]
MFLHALATAVPDTAYTQEECWQLAQQSRLRERLSRRSLLILQSILRREPSVERRHFAMPEIAGVFERSADELNAVFRTAAPRLAGDALQRALAAADLKPDQIDALLVCTCTGYLCPGVSSYVAEQLGLRPNAFLQDLVGLGCGAAIPTLRAANALTAANPDAVVACIAVEVCSAAFYLDDDPGVIISACLFGDGAAASLWCGRPPLHRPRLRAFDFNTVHRPEHRDQLRFEQRDGKLRNLLAPAVPSLAAAAVGELWRHRGDRPVARVVSHGGGRDVLEALAPVLAPHDLAVSAHVLRTHGNMSSPSVLFALAETLESGPPNGAGDFWLVSFGAGFAAHSCRLGAA